MILFPGSTLLAGPKHSTSVPFSAGSAVPLSVDEKDEPLVPNPIPEVAVKASFGPHIDVEVSRCKRGHSRLVPSPTLQRVVPLISPLTVHLKVNISPEQVGGAAVNCPATSPESD